MCTFLGILVVCQLIVNVNMYIQNKKDLDIFLKDTRDIVYFSKERDYNLLLFC